MCVCVCACVCACVCVRVHRGLPTDTPTPRSIVTTPSGTHLVLCTQKSGPCTEAPLCGSPWSPGPRVLGSSLREESQALLQTDGRSGPRWSSPPHSQSRSCARPPKRHESGPKSVRITHDVSASSASCWVPPARWLGNGGGETA